MLNICIDFGNSSIKAAMFEGKILVQNYVGLDQVALINLVNSHLDLPLAIASVSGDVTHIVNLIENKTRLTLLTHHTKIPITNLYQTPQTMGMDRLAAVVGAFTKYPTTNCLIIDAGTCITYDFLDKSGNYHGGSISPGINLRFKSLNHFTAKLPLIDNKEFMETLGTNTADAIACGVVQGCIGEIIWIINTYKHTYPDVCVVICGGDAAFFETKIKETIFAIPQLVLIGLNTILNYNAK